jgi:hypothetical protein
MAPFKSSLARSAGKLFGVSRERDTSLRGGVQSSRMLADGTISYPYISAAQASVLGAASGTHYFLLHGDSVQMEFDSTNKFSNGVLGWVKWDRAFVKTINTNDINIESFGTGATCQYTDQGERRWSNGNSSSQTSASDNGRITIPFPNCQYAVLNSMTAVASGSQNPDDSPSWLSTSERYNKLDEYTYGTTGFLTNASGYGWAIVVDTSNTPTSDGTNTNNSTGIILVKLGDEMGDNASGTYNLSFSGGDFSVASFNEEKTNPTMVSFAGDSGDEIVTYNEYEIWAH